MIYWGFLFVSFQAKKVQLLFDIEVLGLGFAAHMHVHTRTHACMHTHTQKHTHNSQPNDCQCHIVNELEDPLHAYIYPRR